jgi:Uma2 family endonuclease
MGGTVTAPTTMVSDRMWRVDDLRNQPEGYRYELIEGVLYMAAMPGWPHGLIVNNLSDILSPWVRSHGLGRVMTAQFALYLNEVNYLDPDLLFIRADQLPKHEGDRGTAAALAVEVLSPSNLRAPREGREALFARAGVTELWYVDYSSRTLEVRRRRGNTYDTSASFKGEDMVTSDELPYLQFCLTALWEGTPGS